MAIADKLTYLNDTKLLLRDAIRRAGHYLPDSATFRSYPYAMLPDESSLSLDFVRGEYVAHNWRDGTVSRAGLSNIMTTTRASGGGYFDHLGVFQWAANNTPRIDHDPATLSSSTSSVTLAAGAVTLAVSYLYPVGSYVRATHDGSNWLSGRVVASTGASVTLWVDRVVGSGTFASWTVIRVLGLLVEESRTNLLTRSSDFANAAWGKGRATVSPAELSRGFSLHTITATETNPNGFQVSQGGVSVSSASSLTASLVAKKGTSDWLMILLADSAPANGVRQWFNLATGQVGGTNTFGTGWSKTAATIQPLGDGLFRVSVTASEVGATARVTTYPSVSGDLAYGCNSGDVGYATAAQLEAGAFPTSYIPTVASQVTRSADVASVNTLSPWYNATEGTLFVEANTSDTRTSGFPVTCSLFSDSNNYMTILYTGGNKLRAEVRYGGVFQALLESSAPLITPSKLAFSYALNNMAVSVNGGAAVIDSSASVPAVTDLTIGKSQGSLYLNGHIRSLEYYPRRLSNTELQEITA